MKRKVVLKRIGIIAAVVVGIIACVIAVAQIILQSRTSAILNDISDIKANEKYKTPVYIDGIEVITQDVSCGCGYRNVCEMEREKHHGGKPVQ